MAAILSPNIVNNNPTAISLIKGLAIRKLRVTPMGTPEDRKPTNTGTALQEQNGVTTPADAAIKLPIPWRLPPRKARVRSIVMKERNIVTTKVIPTSKKMIFEES